jgi:isopenicillin-N epimerase
MSDFGSSLRGDWLLDPAVTYLNHGTVGATPRRVLEHQRALSDEIERQPARFMLRELADPEAEGARSRMREAAADVAAFVGVVTDDFVFVDNITEAANAVLRSFPLTSDDEVIITNLGYGGVSNAATYAARLAGAKLTTIEMPRPGAPMHAFVETIESALTPATRIVLVDHITASTALVLPLAAIAEACHAAGALVLADGAHVPGNIELDISALGVDWYAANLHKWAWAPRSAGFLWTSPEQQVHLRPTVTSWGLDHGLAAEFDLPGTRDPTPVLTAPFAISLMKERGLEAIYAYNHELAWWAGHTLAEAWGTKFATPEEMIGAMVTVQLPSRFDADIDAAEAARAGLEAAGIEVPVYATPTGLETRVSAQIYCDADDIEALAKAVQSL